MSDVPTLSVTLLGAGQEVGRSCCVLQYRGRTIVCDAGVHPAYSGIASLPFIDELDWSTVDALLITHFHLDHAAALTYITEKTNFRDGKGKVYMTHPTKALHKFMMQDFVRMSSTSSDALFSPLDMSMSFASIIPISAHQVITPCPGVTFTPYHAGHVLGACMFLIDIAGLRILYTGDYSREEDRHLVKAEVPPIHPDVLIVESTYGVQSLESRPEKELRFTNLVHSIIRRGGHVLLPAFALGRAQELLLILDEYWKKHPDLHNVPIYYASGLARKSMAVYQTYIHTMNSHIRSRFAKRDNPFVFKYPRGWEKKIAEGPPCVVLASPGFMHSGPSRELFELWAPDSRNGLIITGYSIEGTPARDIMTEPDEFESVKGGMIPRKISVDYISFSAHVDYSQNSEFIELIKAQHVVLVHGEQTAMGRLRAAMTSRYKEREEDVKIHTPRNLETLNLSFRGERVAKAIGTLADAAPQTNDVLSGLLVAKDYSYTLLDPRDLRDFAGLSTCTVTQRQKIALGVRWGLVRWHLEGMYGHVEEGLDKDGVPTMRVMGAIDVKQTQEHELTLEWDSSASNDMLADATLALIIGIDKSPASVKLTSQEHSHEHPDAYEHPHADPDPDDDTTSMKRIQRLIMFLEAHFGEVELHMPEELDEEEQEPGGPGNEPSLLVQLDEADARISLVSMIVTSSNESLRKRVETVLDMAVTTVSSLTESFSSTKSPPFDLPQDASTETEGVVAPDVSSAAKPASKSRAQDEESNESDLEVHG
ncbi:Metallo-hydrolase oxidoreductase [Guyanagaster necrorhizus]|uniref:Endoribonuclease YSH1 n=1 Tax=Guyanagaster necrorhizus TaxID=856835 RepID=A0A9P7W057_9AGAR|nr:Metallo-hydrolase oxidoreductase [Guyanagaster necrorhizus MCA 3950]KAG7449534.1 Metallo-hydrolase oxidoreductase [Guyanagaster necrorhizus MCA 3950]